VRPRTLVLLLFPADGYMGFNRGSPKLSLDRVGPSLTVARAVEPVARSALMQRGTRRRAPSTTAAAAFRKKLAQYRYVSSCTARVGAAVRSIPSGEGVVPLAVQVSFARIHEYPAESFGYMTNRKKEDLSVYVEMSVVLATRWAIRDVLSKYDHPPI